MTLPFPEDSIFLSFFFVASPTLSRVTHTERKIIEATAYDASLLQVGSEDLRSSHMGNMYILPGKPHHLTPENTSNQ